MKKSRLAYGFATSIGLGRRSNQDAWLASPDQGVFVVADGVGGGANGDVASKTVTESVAESLRSESEADNLDEVMARVSAGLKRAHDKLRAMPVDDDAQRKSCATTVVGLTIEMPEAEQVGVLSVGDSRIYRLRDGRLDCLTTDDARWRWRGWQGCKRLPFRKYLTQAIGTAHWREPAQRQDPACTGDTYLLCTDGLWGVLGDKGLRTTMADQDRDMQQIAEKFVEQALALGGRDNITCCLVRIMVKDNSGIYASDPQTVETDFSGTQEIISVGTDEDALNGSQQEAKRGKTETRAKRGSVVVEFVMLLGLFVVPVLVLLMNEFNGGGPGILRALRTFAARIMVVIGLPLL